MKKMVNLLLYCLLGVVVSVGMIGMRQFMVQDQERIEREEEEQRQAALAQEELEARQLEERKRLEESRRVVLVRSLPLYPEKKIQKVKTGRDTICTYGETVLLLEEDGLYAKVQTGTGATGYVWRDGIASASDRSVPADTQPKVVVLDVEQGGKETDSICFSVAENVEKRLEALGYEAVMVGRKTQEVPSDAKRAELASQIEADAVIRLCIGGADVQGQTDGTQAGNETLTGNGTQANGGTQTGNGTQENGGTQTGNGTQENGGTQTGDGTQENGGTQTGDGTQTDNGAQENGGTQAGDGTQADVETQENGGTPADPTQTDAVHTENEVQARDVAVICSSKDNPHTAAEYSADSRKLGKSVLQAYQAVTGFDGGEVVETSGQKAVNLSKRPMIVLCMGSLRNEQQATKMARPKFQAKMAKGITDGVDAYLRKGNL